MRIRKRKTERGFDIIEFTDKYGKECSIQKSSLATEDAIWFGVNKEDPTIGGTRMHLTQKDVKKLLPILQLFVETGEITKEK